MDKTFPNGAGFCLWLEDNGLSPAPEKRRREEGAEQRGIEERGQEQQNSAMVFYGLKK